MNRIDNVEHILAESGISSPLPASRLKEQWDVYIETINSMLP